jgi:glycosyltransferase involved in cell wall biosynthesis
LIDVLVPTYGRPDSLQRLFDNVRETSDDVQVTFIVERDDDASYEAAREIVDAIVLVNAAEPSYSNALQHGYRRTLEKFFIAGNDDFDFQPGWDKAALELLADPDIDVVGVDDGDPNTKYSTIAVVRRSYIEQRSGCIGYPGRVFYPYQHNFVDTEFFHTAVARGVFCPCPQSKIFHLHPDFGHATDDATYQKGRKSFADDAGTFQARRWLWLKEANDPWDGEPFEWPPPPEELERVAAEMEAKNAD